MTGQALPPDLAIDLRQLVMTIANTIDLVGVDDVLHGRRVGMLAREMACQLGWDEKAQLLLYDAGLLHDCGVSSTRVHRRLVAELEWSGAQEHCLRGEELLRDFAPLAHLTEIIEDPHGRKSIIVTSQLPELDWYDAIGDTTVADAILDRIVHTAHRITLTGESVRKLKAFKGR